MALSESLPLNQELKNTTPKLPKHLSHVTQAVSASPHGGYPSCEGKRGDAEGAITAPSAPWPL